MPILNDDRGPKSMKTPVSLTGLSAAIMLFVIGVVMHEAARADRSIVPASATLPTVRPEARSPSSLARLHHARREGASKTL